MYTWWTHDAVFWRVRKISESFAMSVCPSVRMEQLGPTGRIFIEFDIWVFYENL